MFNTRSTNADITQHDWAKRDRATLLCVLHAKRVPLAQSAVSSAWGTNVAYGDPRSVHAYLAGRGDLRTTWWNLYSAVYMTAVSGATLEQAMYSFHRIHHWLTFSRLAFAHSLAQTASDVEREGIFSAARNSIVREMRR